MSVLEAKEKYVETILKVGFPILYILVTAVYKLTPCLL